MIRVYNFSVRTCTVIKNITKIEGQYTAFRSVPAIRRSINGSDSILVHFMIRE